MSVHCATIGCHAIATHTIDIELGPEPICAECAAGYMRRPAIMAHAYIERINPLAVGYAMARASHGDTYADYLIEHDAELVGKGIMPKPWPLSLEGNDGI